MNFFQNLKENQKNPEQIAINKGQNIQKLENTEKQNTDLNLEIEKVEASYIEANNKSVSYTHLTLPTNREV